MSREWGWVLVLGVLTVIIWVVTAFMWRPAPHSMMEWVLLAGSIWATIDLLRALWRAVRARPEPEEGWEGE